MLRLRRAEMPSTAQRPSALISRSSLCRAGSSSSKTLSRHASNAAKPRSSRRTSPRSTHSIRSVRLRRNARSWLTTTKAVRLAARCASSQAIAAMSRWLVGSSSSSSSGASAISFASAARRRSPPARPLRRQRGVEPQPLHRRRHPPLLAGAEPLPREGPERREPAEVRVLRHVADARPRPHEARARVGLDQPRHQLHQRRLARAVPPDQRDPLARMHRQPRALEQGVAPEGQAHVGEGQDRGLGHARALRPPPTPVNPAPAPAPGIHPRGGQRPDRGRPGSGRRRPKARLRRRRGGTAAARRRAPGADSVTRASPPAPARPAPPLPPAPARA